jgi:hypothetical protein
VKAELGWHDLSVLNFGQHYVPIGNQPSIQYVAPLRPVAFLWTQVLIVEGTTLTLSVLGAVPDKGCESVDAVVKVHSVLYD